MAYKKKKPVDMSTFSLEKQEERARSYLYWYLGNQMETEHALRKKLANKKYDESIIELVISEFVDAGYLNDESYVNMYMDSSRAETLGRNGIRHKLRDKGIDEELINVALDNIKQEQEEETAYNVAYKKALTFDEDLPYEKKMSRLVGLLSRKGFAGDIVFPTARTVIEETTTNEEGAD